MAFTDDDLKRLKEHADCLTKSWVIHYKTSDGISRQFDIKALLARIEAAEKVIERATGHDEDCDEVNGYGNCSCGHDAVYKAWRKSAGRGAK